MREIAPGQIEAAVEQFLRPQSEVSDGRRRERSWDLCFDHFQNHPAPTDTIELSSLHLGYYLASWGMLRGSSFLLHETNALHYRKAIQVIEKHNDAMRGFDVPQYLDEGCYGKYDQVWTDLRAALIPAGISEVTLVSKVMMGVWGCIPALDTNFRKTFKDLSTTRSERGAWNKGNRLALAMLHEVWREHRDEIERVRSSYPVWSLATREPTARELTCAKVLDIYGFQMAASKGRQRVGRNKALWPPMSEID